VAEEPSSPVTSSNLLNTKVTPEIQERSKRGRYDSFRLEGSNLDHDPKTLEREKVVLGNAEDILEKGSLMKKKNLCLLPKNMAMYLLKNRHITMWTAYVSC
jgi:hypothetical protein